MLPAKDGGCPGSKVPKVLPPDWSKVAKQEIAKYVLTGSAAIDQRTRLTWLCTRSQDARRRGGQRDLEGDPDVEERASVCPYIVLVLYWYPSEVPLC